MLFKPKSQEDIIKGLSLLSKKDLNLFLMTAVKNNRNFIDILIKSGADVNSNINGDTPLMWASYYGFTHIVKKLLQAGADVNIKSGHETALSWALSKEHTEIIELLKKYGAM